MRHIKAIFLVGLFGLVAAAPVAAGELIFGAKTGPMMIDVSGIDDPTNIGLMVGYQQGVVLGDLAIEGEFTTSSSDGDLAGNKVSIDTMAVYAALRTAGPIYFKVKGGFLQEDVKIGSSSDSDSGMSYGAGVGFGIGILQLELEYTQVEQDVSFLSLGVQF